MKFLLVLSVILSLSMAAIADGLRYSPNGPSEAKVLAVQDSFVKKYMGARTGVNGVGVTACEEKSGIPFSKFRESTLPRRVFVLCLDVTTETEEAAQAMRKIFPTGSKYYGVYISLLTVGRIIAQ